MRFKVEIEFVGFDSMAAMIEHLEGLTDDEPVVIREWDRGNLYHGVPGVRCEGCEGTPFPGIRWPTAANGDESRSWVERCDTCERYDSDRDAARALRDNYYEQDEYEFGEAYPAGSSSRTPYFEVG